MRGFFSISLVVAFLAMISAAGAAEPGPLLRLELARGNPSLALPVHLRLTGALNPADYSRGRQGAAALILALRERAEASRRDLLPLLEARGATEIRAHWIVNGITCLASPALITELAAMPGVESILSGAAPRIDRPRLSPVTERSAVWNVGLIDAERVWAELGIDGSGIVVGSMDGGVDADHQALAGKWRGGDNSWIDLISGLPYPYDDTGHGTHTTGSMIGGDGLGPLNFDIGVAPGAQFIAAKMFDDSGHPPDIGYIFAAGEWMLDPDGNPATDDFPHVVNNSWAWAPNDNPVFHAMTEAWLAAGIVPIFSMGNLGPSSDSTQPPGNYDNTIGVAASTMGDEVAYFSSRGPAPYGWAFPADRRKPDLTAPGEGVISAIPGDAYAAGSGTSMAAPHIAGVVALLLQANPDLDFALLKSILFETAVDIDWPGYEHNSGHGRVDAFAAVSAAIAGTSVPPTHSGTSGARAWPNPFRNSVRIEFTSEERGDGERELRILDPRGRLLRVLRGEDATRWDGLNSRGGRIGGGVYFYYLRAGDTRSEGKLVLLK